MRQLFRADSVSVICDLPEAQKLAAIGFDRLGDEGFLSEDRRLAVAAVHQADKQDDWAAAGLKDTLLRCEVKPEVVYGNEKAVQPRVQV